MIDFDVVVVTWNSALVLPECLRHLGRSIDEASTDARLIVVDNASSDPSASIARAAGATLIENPVNAGFAVAVNQGFAHVRAPWFALLNPDVLVAPDFVRELHAAAAAVPASVAAIVPEVRYRDDPRVVNSRGLEVDIAGVPGEIDGGISIGAGPEDAPPFGGSGGACMLRTEAFRAVGGLEPAFFAYLEDVDLAWRLQRSGLTAVHAPAAVALHWGSSSTGEGAALKLWLVARNRRLLFRRHGPRRLRARITRSIVDSAHAVFSATAYRSVEPFRGRAAALQKRSYISSLQNGDRRLALPSDAVQLTERTSLGETFRRKRAARRLMKSASFAASSSPNADA